MILLHDYKGQAGRCNRCGLSRRQGAGLPCELPDEIESADVEIRAGSPSGGPEPLERT